MVWVNATNLFDAAAGFGGVRESGFGREGGWEGLDAYLKPRTKTKPLAKIAPHTGEGSALDPVDRTAKLYIGGKQARPDGGYSRNVYAPKGAILGQVGEANRKDIRNAVEAASKAQPAWGNATGHLRAQVLYYIGENLSARSQEFVDRIRAMTGANAKTAEAEVAASIEKLFSHAAWADKYDGAVHGVPIRGVALAMNEPVGTIGAFCPDDAPLLGLISVMAPAMAMGNASVLVASEAFPLAATDFYQILETSDVPGGVVNILTGDHAALAAQLAGHMDVDAVWSFSSSDLSATIEKEAAGNLKRTWVNYARHRDISAIPDREFLAHATEVKNIWIPYGEG